MFCVREGPAPLTPTLTLVYIVLLLLQDIIHLVMLCLKFEIAKLFVDLFIVREGPAPLTPTLTLVYIVLMLLQVVRHIVMLCL